jgi:nucleoid-associated protein YgaU
MSVATEFAPDVYIPARARTHRHLRVASGFVADCDGVSVLEPATFDGPARLARVSVLAPPRAAAATAPVRLTRRGVVVLSMLVAVVGLALVWVARVSAPAAPPAAPKPWSVTVQAGDTLWSIATQVAPQSDPRDEVTRLQARNHLTSVDLLPGQVLVVP